MGQVQGTVGLSAAGSGDIIATPGAGKRLHILKVVVSVYLHQDTGTVAISDGTTTIWKVLAKDDNGSSWTLDWGPEGYTFAANKALVLTVATADVDCIATAVARLS